MIRRNLIRTFAALAAALAFGASAQSDYPNRPITLVVPWGAGGGTDAAPGGG